MDCGYQQQLASYSKDREILYEMTLPEIDDYSIDTFNLE